MSKDRTPYDNPEHKAKQTQYRTLVNTGNAYCTEPTCLIEQDGGTRHIPPGSKVDAAHDDNNPGQYLGPAHPRCNRSKGGKKRHTGVKRSYAWL